MDTFDADMLETMKRADLQKLCKSIGIKANSKTVQLIEALKEHAKNVSEKVDSQRSSGQDNQEENAFFAESEKRVEMSLTMAKTATATRRSNRDNNDTYTQELLEHLEKKVDEKMPTECKIPRFVQFIDKSKSISEVKKDSNKWDSIHKSQFEKMDSIDVYLEKKRKRMESLNHSVKRAKTAINASKSCGASNTSILKKTPARKSLGLTRKSKGGSAERVFNPSNSKSTTFSFAFGSPMAKPVFQPPSRKSAVTLPVTFSPTGEKKLQDKSHTPGNVTRKSIATTPFRFLPANVPTVLTPKRKFDLKASLAKPLPYKPYTGKIKNHTEFKKEFKPTITEAKLKKHRVEVKTAKLTTREERRLKTIKKRESRKENAASKRRGLESTLAGTTHQIQN